MRNTAQNMQYICLRFARSVTVLVHTVAKNEHADRRTHTHKRMLMQRNDRLFSSVSSFVISGGESELLTATSRADRKQ